MTYMDGDLALIEICNEDCGPVWQESGS